MGLLCDYEPSDGPSFQALIWMWTDCSKIRAEGLTKSDMAVHGCAELSLYDTVCNILLLLMRPNVSPPSVHNHIFRCNGDNY